MPYEPIRCPSCGSVKTIAAENKRFFCASCDGWFVWTDATHAKAADPPQYEIIEGMQKELRELRALVKEKGTIPEPPAPADSLEFSRAQLCKFEYQDWFYQTWNGDTKGPVRFGRLLELEKSGNITRHSNIKVRNQPWTSLAKLAEIDGILRELREHRTQADSTGEADPRFDSINFPEGSDQDPFFLHNQAEALPANVSRYLKQRSEKQPGGVDFGVICLLILVLLFFAALIVPQQFKEQEKVKTVTPAQVEHHQGPHDGHLVEFGDDHKLMAEITYKADPVKSRCMWWITTIPRKPSASKSNI